MIKKNYHTHNYRCKHAAGEVSDYCKVAVENDMEVLGISDHTPLPDNRWSFERMDYEELRSYVDAIECAQNAFRNLIVLKSMECDFVETFTSFFKEELLGFYNLDYLIGAVHWFPLGNEWIRVPGGQKGKGCLRAYTKHYIKAMSSGLYLFMAHPDIFGSFYPDWDFEARECSRTILQAAQDLDVPIEINMQGFRKSLVQGKDGLRNKYPLIQFWEMAAKYEVRIVISSDAHKPEDLTRNFSESLEIADKFGLCFADFSFLEKRHGKSCLEKKRKQ